MNKHFFIQLMTDELVIILTDVDYVVLCFYFILEICSIHCLFFIYSVVSYTLKVIPVRLDKDEEAVDQWFGGEWKVPPHDLSKFAHLRSGKRWWSAYLLFYEREDFHEQIKNISIPKLGMLQCLLFLSLQNFILK